MAYIPDPATAMEIIPAAAASLAAEASSQPRGAMPNGRQAKLMKLIHDAVRDGEKNTQTLIKDAVERVAKVVLGERASARLREAGYLNVTIRLLKVDSCLQESPSEIAECIEGIEIPGALKKDIEDALIKEIGPRSIEIDASAVNDRGISILRTIRLNVACCNLTMEINDDGSIGKSYESNPHRHEEGHSQVQNTLAKLESEYTNRKPDEAKVDKIIDDVFDPNNENTPFSRLVKTVEAGEARGRVRLRVVFNCTSEQMGSLFGLVFKEKHPVHPTYLAPVSANLGEIGLLFQRMKLRTDLASPPTCKAITFTMEKNISHAKETDKKVYGTREDHVKLLADFDL